MNYFRKSKAIEYFVIIFIGLFVYVGCAALQGTALPKTPVGRYALYGGTFHSLVDQYNDEIGWAETAEHKAVLAKRKIAITELYIPMKLYKNTVQTGTFPAYELERAITSRLSQFKKLLYTYQSVVPTKDKIRGLLVKAQAQEKIESQGAGGLILLLIELAQTLVPFLTSLISQSNMTPEQVQAKFDFEAAWIDGFNPSLLADPV